jgi:hypothetical protein
MVSKIKKLLAVVMTLAVLLTLPQQKAEANVIADTCYKAWSSIKSAGKATSHFLFGCFYDKNNTDVAGWQRTTSGVIWGTVLISLGIFCVNVVGRKSMSDNHKTISENQDRARREGKEWGCKNYGSEYYIDWTTYPPMCVSYAGY